MFVCCCYFAGAGVRGEGADVEPELKKQSCLDHTLKLSATRDTTASWLAKIQIAKSARHRHRGRNVAN